MRYPVANITGIRHGLVYLNLPGQTFRFATHLAYCRFNVTTTIIVLRSTLKYAKLLLIK